MKRFASLFTVAYVVASLWCRAAHAAPEPTYQALNPYGEIDPPQLRVIAPRVAHLDGTTIGLFVNMKRAAPPLQSTVEARLKTQFPNARLVTFRYLENADIAFSLYRRAYEDWLKQVDVVIAAVGDCGSCTKFLIYNTIFAEDHGKPAVALVNKGFMNDARATAAIRGMPGLRGGGRERAARKHGHEAHRGRCRRGDTADHRRPPKRRWPRCSRARTCRAMP